MVKEVEFSNFIETYNSEQDLSIGIDVPSFEGYVYNDGMNLRLISNTALPAETAGARKLMVYYGNVDFEVMQVEWHQIHSTDLHTCSTIAHAKIPYNIDLSKVATIPKKIYNVGGTSDIVIEIYTYEANITTDYGSKRLSAPYTVENNDQFKYDKSTDGIYRIILCDIPQWHHMVEYNVGDLVTLDNAIYYALKVNTAIPPQDPDNRLYWRPATDDDVREYAFGNAANPPIKSIISDMLISHDAKYGIIGEYIEQIGYKDHDDAKAYEVITILQSYREIARHELLQHKPINALYQLFNLRIEASRLRDKTEVRVYNIKYTL
jgi:hypothetical protein